MASAAADFVRRSTRYGMVELRAEFSETFAAIGLFHADGFARLASAAVLSTGRAPTRVLPLPGHSEQAVLRWLRHGGLLGPCLGGLFVGVARGRRELAVNRALRAAGAPVPAPLFYAARRVVGPLYEGVYATVLEARTEDALAFLSAAPERPRVLAACAAAGKSVRRFHDAGGRHADLHLKNLLLREHAETFEVLIVDLDRARIGESPTPARRLRELARLDRSLLKRGIAARVGARGIARFFGAYCDGDRALRRDLIARFPAERRRLEWHALGYRLLRP
jgi:3-deoxy-D-manno-octulosonic acid kinase